MIPASGGPGLYFPDGVNATKEFAALKSQPYFVAAAKEHQARVPELLGACAKKQGADECNATALALEDFAELYAESSFSPALAPFWDSDAAFARMRVSVAPLLLRLATALPEGMMADDIEGGWVWVAGWVDVQATLAPSLPGARMHACMHAYTGPANG